MEINGYWERSSLTLMIFLGLLFVEADAVQCYVCSPENDNLCAPLELWGTVTNCPEGVRVCYKSWTIEADPKTVRRCGKPRDKPDATKACTNALKGNNAALVCKCGSDGCNGSNSVTAPVYLLLSMSMLSASLYSDILSK